MPLSKKTDDTDRLARALAIPTGETTTQVPTTALRERLAGERARPEASADLLARIDAFSRRIHEAYDTRPVSKTEWDAASGDEG